MRVVTNTAEKSRTYRKQNPSANGLGRICIACDGSESTQYGEQLIKCVECGLISAKEIPTFEELSQLYEKEYFFGMEYSDYEADRPALEKNFKQRIKFLSPFLTKQTRLAEVGCAYGYFLNLIKDKVEWHKGYDVSTDGVAYAVDELNLNATTTDFLKDEELKPSSIDVVCMWDVMEHFGEPHKHVQKAAQILKPGGVLSLTTGDISAFVARQRGAKWRMIHPPTHIYYFTPQSMQKLLEKYGLKTVSLRYKPTYRNTGSVFNQLICNRKAKDKGSGMLELGQKIVRTTKLDTLNVPLNLFDVMEVTAVKV